MTIPEGFSNRYVDQQDALIADLRMMLNESAAVHADLKESMIKMVAEVATWRTRAERAEAALDNCRRVVAAIPWRSLASIYAHPGVVLDADADAVGEFLDQYADEWAGGFELRLIEEKQLERQAEDYACSLIAGFAPSDLGPITQESLLPDVMPPLGRRTIEIMERKIAPSDNDLASDTYPWVSA